jgi:hypothetical protein
MESRPVDPRDTGWEVEATVYRVYFWAPRRTENPSQTPAWTSDEHELLGARDVVEVVDWAEANAAGRRYTLYVVLEKPGGSGRGLIRLAGVDPTAPA